MGKQSPKKRKSEVNSNESPKKAKVVAVSAKTPVNSPVKQTPQKNKTPKFQKKQKPQSPAKQPIINGVANKKVQIHVHNQDTPAKKIDDKKYPVTPAAKAKAGKTPKQQQKGTKTPAATPNKKNENKLEKFTGVKCLESSPVNSEKNKTRWRKNKKVISEEAAEGLNKRQKKRLREKLRKNIVIQTKKAQAGKKPAGNTATNISIKEITENVAEGKTDEKPMTKTQMRKLKRMQKMSNSVNAENINKPQNAVQSSKTKNNQKKGTNTKNKPQQTKSNEANAVKSNQGSQNKKKKENKNQKKGNQEQQQKIQLKQVEADKDTAEAMEDDESDYEVEISIKPEKVSKKMNETNDSVSEEADDDEDEEEIEEEESDDEENDEETDNSVNENNENEQKDQKKQKKQPNKNIKGKQVNPKDLKDAGLLKKGQSRYVVFVGNLPFDASKEQIVEHFQKSCQVKDVRIPTDKESKKPRGFAYLEVPNEETYHKALALHHSVISGRRINVLYTHGGTKNTENMKQTIKSKNFKLQAMRRDGKLPGGVKDSQRRSIRRAKKRSFEKKQE